MQNTRRIFGYERNVFFTGLTSFFTDTSIKMIYSVMPLFLMSIGASRTVISAIEGIAESTASLLKGFSGYWSDRVGKNKPLMIVGYGITALVTPLYALVRLPVEVLFLRFFERVGKGLRTAPRDSLISASVQGNTTGKSFGFHKAMDNSGAIIGPLAAFLLLRYFPSDYPLIFLLAAIPALLGVATIAVFIKEVRRTSPENPIRFRWRGLPKRFYLFLAILFVFTLGNSTDALLLVRSAETGIGKAWIPFLYMLFNTVSVFLAIPIGRLSDRIGREKLIILGFFVYAVVYFCFGRFSNISLYIALFMGYGLYSALADTSQKALVSDLAGQELRGTGFGLYHALLGVTLLPASLIAGLLYDHVSPSAPFYFGSAMAMLATMLMVGFVLRRAK